MFCKLLKLKFLYFLLLFVTVPFSAFAGEVIGQDTTFSVYSVNFLDVEQYGEYADVWNFFFTIELLVGLVALFFRWIGRVMRA